MSSHLRDNMLTRFRQFAEILFWLALTFLLRSSVLPVKAQTQTYLQSIGVPPFATQIPVEGGWIDAANGDLHIEIPLGSFPQRGGGANQVFLMYDSAIWMIDPTVNSTWQPNNVRNTHGGVSLGGWRVVTKREAGFLNYSETDTGWCPATASSYWATYSPWIWTGPDGTQHSFPASTTAPLWPTPCPGTGTPTSTAYATDGSGYYISITNYTNAVVYAPDGTMISCYDPSITVSTCSPTVYSVNDTNGNYTSPIGYTFSGNVFTFTHVDTLGRTFLTEQHTYGSTVYTFQVANAQGQMSTYTATIQTVPVCPDFAQSGVCNYSGNVYPFSEIDLPDGTKYLFNYDSGTTLGHYGLMTQMTLPTGGVINYSYSNFTDSNGNSYHWITGRTNPDSWTYAPSIVSSCSSGYVDCQQQVTVTKPIVPPATAADQKVYTFTLNGGAWPTKVQYFDHGSGLLGTTIQCFSFVAFTNGSCSYGPTSGSPAPIVRKSGVTTSYPVTNINTTTAYQYDSYGNVTQVAEWNFYTGTIPTNADRTTNLTYLNTSNYLNEDIVNKPSAVVVKDKNGTIIAQTNYFYDDYPLSNAGTVVNNQGSRPYPANLTRISRWLNTTGGWLTTINHYNTVGNLIQTTDPNNNSTSFSYADNYYNYTPSNPTSAYITQITKPATNGVNHIDRMQYYFGSGRQAAACGENFVSTCSYGLSAPQPDYISLSYDSMNRPVGVNAGDGGQTTLTYGTSTPINITATTKVDSTHSIVNTTVIDSLGRISQTQTPSPQGTIYVDTTYDPNGRIYTVKNPHYSGSSPTDGTTTYSYDGLDRVTRVAQPSGGSQTHSYTPDASSIMVQDSDELGNVKNSWVDAFGRIGQVNLFPGSGVVRTQYTYDILNNLTRVDESGTSWSNDRIRTFTYDSLSHLLSVGNQEANAVNYTYDADGNLQTKVNGRGTTITYSYDALNRLTSRSYNDSVTPTANFVYDACPTGGCPSGVSPQYPVGRVVKAYTSSAQTFYSYDVLGRNAKQWQCTPVNCATGFIAFTYTHNYLGEQSSISYNGNFTISQAYDSVARITQLTNSNPNTYNPATIVSVSQFSPIGVPTQMSFGNGLAEALAYNNRLQPTQLRVYSPPSTDVLNQTFTWGDPNYANYDNGVLWAWAASGSGTPTFSRSYNYDGLNRLTTMSSPADPSGCTGLSWTDDAWDNRTNQTVTGGTCGQSSLTINTSNHITNTGFSYDNDGNLTAATSPYQYDAEDRITQFNNGPSYGGANYVYDANGCRIEKVTSGGQVHYFYDENGHVIVETDQGGNWTKEYVYMGGQPVAEFSGGQTYFIHADHLGSTRTVTNYAGSVTDGLDYLPYGEQIAGGSFTTHKFTGYERDSISGLDYANARYYNYTLGRFMSVDPAPGDITDPQGLNRYAYVRNNPLSLIDPTGQEYCRTDPSLDAVVCDVTDQQYAQDPWSFGAAGYYYGDITGGVVQDSPDNPNNITVFDSMLLFEQQQQIATQKLQTLSDLNAPPTNQDYVQAIHEEFSKLPDVCSVGVNARLGSGRVSIGADLNSKTGLSFPSVGARVVASGPVRGTVSTKSFGRNAPTVNISARIPGTPVSVGVTTPDGNTISGVTASVNAFGLANVTGYANLGQAYGCTK